nr:myticofensin B3 [Mytilus coruscus]
MKHLFVVLILSLCVAGFHAKKQHISGFNIDQFCPHAQKKCDWWCRYFKYDKGVCEKNRNIECWCYLNKPKPRKVKKSKNRK